MFNSTIYSGFIPSEWKKARVSPLFKVGARNDINNYRSIPILPIISKVYERILHDQLYAYLSDHNLHCILANEQFGFRRLQSTMTDLPSSTNTWLVNMAPVSLYGLDSSRHIDIFKTNTTLFKFKNMFRQKLLSSSV